MKKILVAYFSASGETAKLAKTIAGVVAVSYTHLTLPTKLEV